VREQDEGLNERIHVGSRSETGPGRRETDASEGYVSELIEIGASEGCSLPRRPTVLCDDGYGRSPVEIPRLEKSVLAADRDGMLRVEDGDIDEQRTRSGQIADLIVPVLAAVGRVEEVTARRGGADNPTVRAIRERHRVDLDAGLDRPGQSAVIRS